MKHKVIFHSISDGSGLLYGWLIMVSIYIISIIKPYQGLNSFSETLGVIHNLNFLFKIAKTNSLKDIER